MAKFKSIILCFAFLLALSSNQKVYASESEGFTHGEEIVTEESEQTNDSEVTNSNADSVDNDILGDSSGIGTDGSESLEESMGTVSGNDLGSVALFGEDSGTDTGGTVIVYDFEELTSNCQLITEHLEDMYILMTVQSVLLCSFIIYLLVVRMTSTRKGGA